MKQRVMYRTHKWQTA